MHLMNNIVMLRTLEYHRYFAETITCADQENSVAGGGVRVGLGIFFLVFFF